MKNKQWGFIGVGLIVVIILALGVVGGGAYYVNKKSQDSKKSSSVVITNFEECARETGVVMESYPRQCRTKTGEVFVENIKVDNSIKTQLK